MEKVLSNITKHIILIITLTALLLLCMVYPFLPGKYDALSMPLSMMVQIFGVVGLLLSIVGLLWLILPKYKFIFAKISIYVGAFIMLILSFVAMLSAGKMLGTLTIILGIIAFLKIKMKLKYLKTSDLGIFYSIPFYLICLPVSILVFQLVFAKPLTMWSRNRAIAYASEFIDRINDFQIKNGHYPITLQAMYNDYSPAITGIDKYHYLPYGDSYNVSFEQPRFLFDVIGTREWVVYNPRDEHKVFSHTSWFLLLSKEELERSQGWYDSGLTGQLNWKYFLFD